MEEYKVLFRMRIRHEYFEGNESGCLGLRLRTQPVSLLKSRQMIFKQESADGWILLGNVNSGGVDEETDRLFFDFVVNDPGFLYYTHWEGYDAKGCYEMKLPSDSGVVRVAEEARVTEGKEKKAGVLFSGKLALSNRMYEEAIEVMLDFNSKEVYWEYILVPRKSEHLALKLRLAEQDGKLLFTVPVKAEADFMDKPVLKCVSQAVIKMKSSYPYQLDLIEIIREDPGIKRKVIKGISHPVPGQFHDLRGNNLRQIVYF